MPEPYVFDIERINKELKENSKVIEGIKDYIANKCDVTADTEHSLSGTPSKAVQLAGELIVDDIIPGLGKLFYLIQPVLPSIH